MEDMIDENVVEHLEEDSELISEELEAIICLLYQRRKRNQ